jgi:spore coat protein U-like protein
MAAATPAGACTVSVSSVAFGSYDTLSPTATDSAGSLTAVCHPSDQSIEVWISGGSSASVMARTMRNGTAVLNYNLYADAARTTVWGDGTSGTAVTLNNGIVSGGDRTFTRAIYGRIPALQAVGMGTYNDNLVVTVVF